MILFYKHTIYLFLLLCFISNDVLTEIFSTGSTATILSSNNGRFLHGKSGQLTCFAKVNYPALPFIDVLLVKRINGRNSAFCSVLVNRTLRLNEGGKSLNFNISMLSSDPHVLPLNRSTNMRFIFKFVQESDSGSYLCRFQDEDLNSVETKSLQLYVGEVPRAIDISFEDFSSPDLTIRCKIAVYKPLEVDNQHTAYFGDDQFPTMATFVNDTVMFFDRKYSLFNDYNLSEEAIFSCYARNAYGRSNTISKHIDIPAYAPKLFCLHLNSKDINVGSVLNCTCMFGKPSPQVTARLFNYSGQLMLISNDSSIVTNRPGNFTVTCRAENFMGQVEMSWSVLVRDTHTGHPSLIKRSLNAYYTLILTSSIFASSFFLFMLLCYCRYRCNLRNCRYSPREFSSDSHKSYISDRRSSIFASKIVEDAVNVDLSNEFATTLVEDTFTI